jgi:plastocyanin
MRRSAPNSSEPVTSLLRRRSLLIAVWLLLLIPVSACSATKTVTVTSTAASQTEANQAPHQVTIQGMGFAPVEIHVGVGDSITWLNGDKATHTITSWHKYQGTDHLDYVEIGKVWDSGDIRPGQTFSHTFNQAGTFEYISLPAYLYFEYQQNPVGVVVVS